MRWLKRAIWLPFGVVSVIWLLHAIDAFKISLFTGNWLFAALGMFSLAICALLLVLYLRKSHQKRV